MIATDAICRIFQEERPLSQGRVTTQGCLPHVQSRFSVIGMDSHPARFLHGPSALIWFGRSRVQRRGRPHWGGENSNRNKPSVPGRGDPSSVMTAQFLHTCESAVRTLILCVETNRSTSVMGWDSPSGACSTVRAKHLCEWSPVAPGQRVKTRVLDSWILFLALP